MLNQRNHVSYNHFYLNWWSLPSLYNERQLSKYKGKKDKDIATTQKEKQPKLFKNTKNSNPGQ